MAENLYTLEYFVDRGVGAGLVQADLDHYGASLRQHIAYVQEACRLIGGVPYAQWIVHDLSKFGISEFPHYARQFFGDKDDPTGFAGAWLHHIHHNPHHWQHWMFADGYTIPGSIIEQGMLPMPSVYLREMVADWMGAGRLYTGKWDMSQWLLVNLPKIRLHSQTRRALNTILTSVPLDYRHVLDQLRASGAPEELWTY